MGEALSKGFKPNFVSRGKLAKYEKKGNRIVQQILGRGEPPLTGHDKLLRGDPDQKRNRGKQRVAKTARSGRGAVGKEIQIKSTQEKTSNIKHHGSSFLNSAWPSISP